MQTTLQYFLKGLFQAGEVVVAEEIKPFSEKELTAATILLQLEYDRQKLKLPTPLPQFNEKAALWGTTFLYRAVQLTMMRDLDEAAIQQHLPKWELPMNASITISVDLTFQYLRDVFDLAKGLSPDDELVKILKMTAIQFPFSSIGMNLQTIENESIILNNPSLKLAYLDKIIEKRDLKRVEQSNLFPEIKAILGDYTFEFWPALRNYNHR